MPPDRQPPDNPSPALSAATPGQDRLTPDQILAAVSAFFGQPVRKLTAPGGRSRSSFRAWLDDRTLIVSQRPDGDQARVERLVLSALQPHTDAVPRLLGQSGRLMFQSDVGITRLNALIHATPGDQRSALADQAVAALFEVQRAGHRAGLAEAGLPLKGFFATPDDDITGVPARALRQMAMRDPGFDPARLSPLFSAPPCRFVKWDCRAGNAALDAAGQLRWFDFEDARLAQGPEDFAWLIADEVWPLPVDAMLDLIRARLGPQDCSDPQVWMTYLEEYATLHALRRIRLIFAEARRGGWMELPEIVKFDRVGVNPHLGEHLSLRGAMLAGRNASTAPLIPLFNALASVFRKVRRPAAAPPATDPDA